eukprot:973992-Pelagomonas_calceolata.AAC.2
MGDAGAPQKHAPNAQFISCMLATENQIAFSPSNTSSRYDQAKLKAQEPVPDKAPKAQHDKSGME